MRNCEYIVYTNDKSNLTDAENAAVYDVLSTLQYPMNTNPLNENKIQELSPAHQALLSDQEDTVILAKLREINPRIKIALIPKSLQQMYLHLALRNSTLSEPHATVRDTFDTLFQERKAKRFAELKRYGRIKNEEELQYRATEILGTLRIDVANSRHFMDGKAFYYACAEDNNKPHVRQIWTALNNALVNEFAGSGYAFNKSDLLQMVDNWIKGFTVKNQAIGNTYPYGQEESAEDLEILRKALAFEIDVIFNPKINHLYATYRGSWLGQDSDLNLLEAEPNHDLSIGNGLLEGLFFDPGACAWHYMKDKDKHSLPNDANRNSLTGYALLIDPKTSHNEIIIPPLTNVARTLGDGEYFHVRSNHNYKLQVKKLLRDNTFLLVDRRAMISNDSRYFPLTNTVSANIDTLAIDKSSLTAYLWSAYRNDSHVPYPITNKTASNIANTCLTETTTVTTCYTPSEVTISTYSWSSSGKSTSHFTKLPVMSAAVSASGEVIIKNNPEPLMFSNPAQNNAAIDRGPAKLDRSAHFEKFAPELLLSLMFWMAMIFGPKVFLKPIKKVIGPAI